MLMLTACSTTPTWDSARYPASTDFKATLEKWKSDNKQVRFVVRDEDGVFARWGILTLESWNDNDPEVSEWVARRENGTFVSGGYKGKLEKFKVAGHDREEYRVVFRKKGQFVTWVAIDDLITSKWERWRNPRTGIEEGRYVVRYNGQLVNHSTAKLENWQNYEHPVLVARDTADAGNNGKLLSWIAPQLKSNGIVYYMNPDDSKELPWTYLRE